MEKSTDRPLHALGLIEARQGIESRRFTAEAYTRALLARIEARDAGIGAWIWLDPERALAAARQCDRRLAAGEPPGPLAGLPIGVKDIFATAGIPTEMGSPAFAGHVPARSAAVVERLEAQGGFVMGKTVTTECAFMFPGKTKNPWNPAHTPGGSSSGSVAAVAAGFVPGALGTQTNGSVIRPAAFCGIVGFKPTQGRIPIAGALIFSHTLDQPGVFTRSVADAAWLAAALENGGAAFPPAAPPPAKPPRLAAVRTPVWDQAEPGAREKFRADVETLRQGGAAVEEVELPAGFNLGHGAIRTIMTVESAFHFAALEGEKAPLLSATLKDFTAEGRQTLAVAYLEVLEIRRDLQAALEAFLAPYAALVTPPAPGEAPATLSQTGNAAFCSLWSLCGVPAITLPTGFGPAGLPLGLQIVGAHGRDAGLLAAARWCETRFPFSPLR
jgi:Asp-tRNA(Asn)/Glu-tRNA(Gln) amidotransferase A subunit family amidase